VTGFLGQYSFFRAMAATAFLAAHLFNPGAFGGEAFFSHRLNFVEQEFAGEKAVETLLASFLAFDLHASRTMKQHDARGYFIDVLAAMTAGADECFFNIRFAHAEGSHPLGKLCLFIGCRLKGAHLGSVTLQWRDRNAFGPRLSVAM